MKTTADKIAAALIAAHETVDAFYETYTEYESYELVKKIEKLNKALDALKEEW